MESLLKVVLVISGWIFKGDIYDLVVSLLFSLFNSIASLFISIINSIFFTITNFLIEVLKTVGGTVLNLVVAAVIAIVLYLISEVHAFSFIDKYKTRK